MRILKSLKLVSLLVGDVASGRWSEGTIIDDGPLVVLYYENWAGWVRAFSPSHIEKNFLSREIPARNFVLNYAFFTWNRDECSLVAVDTIDLQKGDHGDWSDSDWNIESQDEWETKKPAGGHLTAFQLLKSRFPYIKLMPSIGGWSRSNTFHSCLINKMDHMVQSVRDHVLVWGWDGIDLDWEYPNCDRAPCGCQDEAVCSKSSGFPNQAGANDWANLLNFVHRVRNVFDELEPTLKRRLYITAALGVNPLLIDGDNDTWSVGTPFKSICENDDFDWVNLMTYDFSGPWSAVTGPLAPLYSNPAVPGKDGRRQMSIEDSLDRILKVCSAPHKLTMGLATYGKTWQGVPKIGSVPGLYATSTSTDPRSGGTWEQGTVSYFDLKKNILPQCPSTWDDVSKTPTAYCETFPLAGDIPYDSSGAGPVPRGQKNTFISYEDGRSWAAKMAYARSKGMAGAIIWAASDTGNGMQFAPDSAADLLNGLIGGWYNTTYIASSPTYLAPRPGSLKRWPEYPCPLPTGYVRPMATVDVSRCASNVYQSNTTYISVPTIPNPSDFGKDKILIHPLTDHPTAAPTTTSVTTLPATTTLSTTRSATTTSVTSNPPTTTTSTTTTVTTTPVTTSPATTAVTTLATTTTSITTPSPTRTSGTTHSATTTTATETTVPSTTTTPGQSNSSSLPSTTPLTTPSTSSSPPITTATSVSTTATSKPATTAVSSTSTTSSSSTSRSIVIGCQSEMSTVVTWHERCEELCAYYYSGPWCSAATTTSELVQCVENLSSFCVPRP